VRGPRPVRDVGQPGLVAVHEDEVTAAGGEPARQRLADAAGRAGHDGGAVGELVGVHQATAFSVVVVDTRGWNVMPSSSSEPHRISRTSRM
jgi:hypothetical protein